MDPDQLKAELRDVVSQLFNDAGVAFDRVSRRGEHYSIANEAYREFFSWFDYPRDEKSFVLTWTRHAPVWNVISTGVKIMPETQPAYSSTRFPG